MLNIMFHLIHQSIELSARAAATTNANRVNNGLVLFWSLWRHVCQNFCIEVLVVCQRHHALHVTRSGHNPSKAKCEEIRTKQEQYRNRQQLTKGSKPNLHVKSVLLLSLASSISRHAKGTEAMKAEQVEYAKYSTWCTETKSDLDNNIKEAQLRQQSSYLTPTSTQARTSPAHFSRNNLFRSK
eukprot:6489438-Amphidinium_carterae.1